MKEPEPRPKLVRDPEVQAMDRISKLLDVLKPRARERVVRWLQHRYYDGIDSPCAQEVDPNF